MTEVCFGASIAGTLTVIGNRYPEEFGDVAYLFLPLHLGDLSQGVFSETRLAWVHSIMSGEWLDGINFEIKEQKKAIREIERIKQYLGNGEKIRIWHSDTAEELCAFYYLLSELEGIDGEITHIHKNSLAVPFNVRYRSLGAIPYEEILLYLPSEQHISKEEVHWGALEWQKHCREKWKLRANLNGELVGVPETLYDSAIMSFIPKKGEFKAIRVCMDFLWDIPSGLDSNTVEWRLSEILHGSEFSTVGEPMPLEKNAYCLMLDRLTFIRKNASTI
jgi:hypothetical protein